MRTFRQYVEAKEENQSCKVCNNKIWDGDEEDPVVANHVDGVCNDCHTMPQWELEKMHPVEQQQFKDKYKAATGRDHRLVAEPETYKDEIPF